MFIPKLKVVHYSYGNAPASPELQRGECVSYL